MYVGHTDGESAVFIALLICETMDDGIQHAENHQDTKTDEIEILHFILNMFRLKAV